MVRYLREEPVLAEWQHMVQITEPGDRGLAVYITPEAVEIRLPTVVWSGPHSPIRSTRLWKRVERATLTDDQLRNLLKKARQARAAEFRTCRYCGKPYPPEHRHSRNVCRGCAEKHLGISH